MKRLLRDGRTDGLTEKVLTHRNQTDRFVPHARIQTIMKSWPGTAALRVGHPTPDPHADNQTNPRRATPDGATP